MSEPPGEKAPDAPGDCLEAALDYEGRGWSVIPLVPGQKRPLVAWAEHQERRAGADEIRGWFRRWPGANLGIVTGAISGLVVLDIDPGHGGAQALDEIVARDGAPPPTLEALTGGGGRHLYFSHPSPHGPGGEVRNRTGLAPGIDLRGDHGMIVAPPSLHPSGRRYEWAEGRGPDAAVPAPLPAWLYALLGSGSGGPKGHPLAYWRSLVHEGVAEGRRNSTIASLAGHLFWRGVDTQVALELLLAWNRQACRPPLSDDEVARTVESIARLHASEGA